MKWKNLFKLTRKKFKCQRCGNCCKTSRGGLSLSVDDLIRWKKAERSDILKHVNMLVFDNNQLEPISIMGNEWDENEQIVLCAALWFKAKGKSLNCPFLKWQDKYECLIYDLRPDDCRQFPFEENGNPNKNLAAMCPEVRRLT